MFYLEASSNFLIQMANFWILLIIINLAKESSTQDVQLSIENSTNSEYVGYVWANNKFVFLTPQLKATALKERSVSEKICGFELTAPQLKTIPFIVYLVDELSGLGEMQVKPHIDLDNNKDSVMRLTVEAYDCDTLPHYSNKVSVAIHVSNSLGPIFNKNAYSFSINKDSYDGYVVGRVSAKGTDNNRIKYSLYHAGNIPFSIDDSGTIRTLSTFKSINYSLIYLRVVATELSKTVHKKSIATITIEVLPICKNKLIGIPDQLDYKIKSGSNGLMEVERLIPDQHQPRLVLCNLDSPFKEMNLLISLLQSRESIVSSDNIKICYTDIAASRLQRRVCNANPGTIDLFLTQGGIIDLTQRTSIIEPENLSNLKDEFTLTWWMKRQNKLNTTIFCFRTNDIKEAVSLSIYDCKIVISISGVKQEMILPNDICAIDSWQFYSISQEWRINPSLRISVADKLLLPVILKETILQGESPRLFIGDCSSTTGNYERQLSRNNPLQLGVISISKDQSLTTEIVGCMSTCGEALLASESMKKLPDILLERRGSSLSFTSNNIPEMTKMLSMIDYVNSYYWSSGRQGLEKVTTHVAIDVSIKCKSEKTINLPRTLIKVNVILPQREANNDTLEVDIYTLSTILAKTSQSIRLFPDFRFINSITEERLKRDIRIETCSIRPLQRNFVINEKVYLSHLMEPILIESNLRIKYDAASWTIEGDGNVELYESLLRHVKFDMVNERRKLFIICTMKNGELTSQAFVDVISPKKNKITIINEENPTDLDHNALNEEKRIVDHEERYSKDHFDITKSKFIAVVIMAVIGGATWAVVTAAIACFIIRRRGNLLTRNRMKLNDIKTYQKEISPTFHSISQTAFNSRNDCTHYEEEDQISMADLPDADEHCLDNVSCDTCNMTDHESCFNNINFIKDIPRSKTINFPIIHKRF